MDGSCPKVSLSLKHLRVEKNDGDELQRSIKLPNLQTYLAENLWFQRSYRKYLKQNTHNFHDFDVDISIYVFQIYSGKLSVQWFSMRFQRSFWHYLWVNFRDLFLYVDLSKQIQWGFKELIFLSLLLGFLFSIQKISSVHSNITKLAVRIWRQFLCHSGWISLLSIFSVC